VGIFDSMRLGAGLVLTRPPVPCRRPPPLARPAVDFVRVLSLEWSFDTVLGVRGVGSGDTKGLTRGWGRRGRLLLLLWHGDGVPLGHYLPVADGTPGFVVVDVHGWGGNKRRGLIKRG